MSEPAAFMIRSELTEWLFEEYKIKRGTTRKLIANGTLKGRKLAPGTWQVFNKSKVKEILKLNGDGGENQKIKT